MEVGQRIRDARVAAGLSQSELAHQLGVETQSVYRYERKGMGLSSQVLARLAAVFNRSPDWFLHGDHAPTKEPVLVPDEPAPSPGWLDFEERGYVDFFRKRGLNDEQFAHARRTPFQGGPPDDYRPYVEICEAMVRQVRGDPDPRPRAPEIIEAEKKAEEQGLPDLSHMVRKKKKR